MTLEGALYCAAAPAAPASADAEPPAPHHVVPSVGDEGFALELKRLRRGVGEGLAIANAYTACLLQRSNASDVWKRVCCGEMGNKAVAAAKRLAGGWLLWGQTTEDPSRIEPDSVSKTLATATMLAGWFKESNNATGREGHVTSHIREELPYLAGWRCQFAGCGRDLKRHHATGGRGRFTYFAHIVAASVNGPRGDPVESKLLASELSNFMLLCDECHRLIDKVNPKKYTTAVLRKMREDSIAEVERLLDTLQHKPAEVVALIGNIAGQAPQFTIDDAQEALWGGKLRSISVKPAYYFYTGAHHDVHSAAYWLTVFHSVKIHNLQARLAGVSEGGAPRPRLAIFPLHGTSVLLLAGRMLGDNAGTYLFQPHRNKIGAGTRWAWPAQILPALPVGKFRVEELVPYVSGETEACFIVALTSEVTPSRVPATCAIDGRFLLPTLRIVGPTFDKDCMRQPEDVQLMALAVDDAVRRLQEQWGVRKVHLFVSAPTSAVVTVGQKLQARHHASYVCYEAVGGPGSPYRPTIEIASAKVTELVSGQANALLLQP